MFEPFWGVGPRVRVVGAVRGMCPGLKFSEVLGVCFEFLCPYEVCEVEWMEGVKGVVLMQSLRPQNYFALCQSVRLLSLLWDTVSQGVRSLQCFWVTVCIQHERAWNLFFIFISYSTWYS